MYIYIYIHIQREGGREGGRDCCVNMSQHNLPIPIHITLLCIHVSFVNINTCVHIWKVSL